MKQKPNLNEGAKPAGLRADAMPIDGYVLSVDGKLKARYETSEEATMAASKLKRDYPVIQVAVYDATTRIRTVVETPGDHSSFAAETAPATTRD
jgi:hypothetical protein